MTDDQDLQLRVPPDRIISLGDQLWFSFLAEKLHFFDPETDAAIFPQHS